MTDPSFQSFLTIEYDPEHGELIEKMNGTIAHVTKVAAQMKEDLLRQAAIIELRKLGYTIIPPETEETS